MPAKPSGGAPYAGQVRWLATGVPTDITVVLTGVAISPRELTGDSMGGVSLRVGPLIEKAPTVSTTIVVIDITMGNGDYRVPLGFLESHMPIS